MREEIKIEVAFWLFVVVLELVFVVGLVWPLLYEEWQNRRQLRQMRRENELARKQRAGGG